MRKNGGSPPALTLETSIVAFRAMNPICSAQTQMLQACQMQEAKRLDPEAFAALALRGVEQAHRNQSAKKSTDTG